VFNEVKSALGPGITVRSPECGYQAPAAKGAIIYSLGLIGQLPEQYIRSKHHYGVAYCEEYDPFRHVLSDMQIHPGTRKRQAKEQIRWLINKGDVASPSTHGQRSLQLIRAFRQRDTLSGNISRVVCVVSNSNTPPTRLGDVNARGTDQDPNNSRSCWLTDN